MNSPSRYREKPATISAMNFTTNNEADSPSMDRIVNWVNQGKSEMGAWHNGTDIFVYSQSCASHPEGLLRAVVGDWIIRYDADGNFSVCKPSIFKAIYEPLEQAS